jgi:hypothetical protein
VALEFREVAEGDCGARSLHQVEIKMQVVQRDKTQSKNFLRFDEMPNVAPRKLAAGCANTSVFDRSFLHREFGVL